MIFTLKKRRKVSAYFLDSCSLDSKKKEPFKVGRLEKKF